MRWQRGEPIVRREVWRGKPWMGTVVLVVEDAPDLLVTYLPEGAPFAFPDGDWPGGRHPWHGRGAWAGHGVLMLHRPGDAYAVWHFWEGASRRFTGWYLNLQDPFRRHCDGFDTMDHELDVWIPAGGVWRFKDAHLLAERVAEGRFTSEEVTSFRRTGDAIGSMLDDGEAWWDEAWTRWAPDRGWEVPALPPRWDA